jgi:hypothetical protein
VRGLKTVLCSLKGKYIRPEKGGEKRKLYLVGTMTQVPKLINE